ncbi:holo-ACP synthase [Marinobacterium sp. YM272]|uniref:holo-ACP synthase n=1 Tax=Marinobacterium sp. YM272 TaxID=3421654 RepID=UPI003D7F99D2
MIIGLGTDLCEIERIEAALARRATLARRILTAAELDLFQVASDPARFLAKRFAAKEAAVKALGTGIGRGVSWHHLCIEKTEAGRPLLRLSGTAAEIARDLGIQHWHLSYSDERHYVVAMVVAEG